VIDTPLATSAPAPMDVHDGHGWPDLPIGVEEDLPRIHPGEYLARSVDVKTFVAFRRRCLAIRFEIMAGPLGAATVVARGVPMYFRLPPRGQRLGRTSKLVRMFALLGPLPARLDRLPMRTLQHRLWRVDVGDVVAGAEQDGTGRHRPLHERQRYSVVRAVLEHIA
jgi:hypothetical protein